MDFNNKNSYSLHDIEDLIKNEVEENLYLDYKAAGALAKDGPKKIEITKDVSSFANSDGGIIIYGVSEKDGKPYEITPIDGKVFSKEWLENVIQTIQPKIDGIKIYPIRVDDAEHSIYVVKIPRSDRTPHMAKDYRYYKRINFQSTPIEDYEVKDLYNRVSTPKLSIEGCSFYKKEEDEANAIYYLKATVHNTGNQVCESYKLNFYINNAVYCTLSHQTLDVRSLFTFMDGNRAKLSSFSQAPIYPSELIDTGFFIISVDKRYERIFTDNLVLHMILFYSGGQDELAFVPSTKNFIRGNEKIIKLLKEKYIGMDYLD